MQDPVLDEQADPSPAPDVTPESSQEAPVEATTPEAVQTPEVPFHEHPRWKEIMEEREYYKQQLAAALNRPQAAPQAPLAEPDPYAGMTAEEKAFYTRIEQIAERKAQKIVAEKEVGFKRELDETKQVLATVAYERFQNKHPDVLPNSPEEANIAALYQRGYNLEDAYKVAMFDKIQQQKVTQAQVKSTQKIQQKVAANVETSSIPASSGLPQGKKMSVREFVEEQIRKGGII